MADHKGSNKTTTLNFIDVFSGAGGLSCGLEQAGLRCLLGVDINKSAIQSFLANHKHAVAFDGDIKKLDKKKLDQLLGGQTVHAVVGGPPCQGFSTVGKGDPKDERNSLFMEFFRLVKVTVPWFVVIENVTGLLAKKNEKTLQNIFWQFEKLGYHLGVQVLSAEKFGTPERRRRTIIIGTRLPVNVVFPIETHDTTINDKYVGPVTVAQALADLSAAKGQIHNHDLNFAALKSETDKKRLARIPEGKGIRYKKDEDQYLPKNLKLGVDWSKLPENRFRQTKYQRLDGQKPSPTIMTHRHGYFHPTENRYLTQREAARLQSFPNDFIFYGPVSEQWRQIGNAVPPKLGEAIGKSIVRMLKEYQTNQSKKAQVQNKKSAPKELLEHKIGRVRGGAFRYKVKNSDETLNN